LTGRYRGHPITRREFLEAAWRSGRATAAGALLAACGADLSQAAFQPATLAPSSTPLTSATGTPRPQASVTPTAGGGERRMGRVSLVNTDDRAAGVRKAIELLGNVPVDGKRVLLKPNFNSADPPPGSTHNDVLRSLVEWLWESGARSITVADRSGMGDTRRVMRDKGVLDMARELGFDPVVLDELGRQDWEYLRPAESHWREGFFIARPCLEADVVVQTCCLKTHRYGGHFTLSLKNSVGLVAKTVPGDSYDFMNELHSTAHQRRMIAEINTAYAPSLILMDGVEAFVNGGPDRGKKVDSKVVLAATDRVAMDAVGAALLRMYGTTPEVGRGRVFELEQIARAVELGLGVASAEEIEIVTGDRESAAYADQVREVLVQ